MPEMLRNMLRKAAVGPETVGRLRRRRDLTRHQRRLWWRERFPTGENSNSYHHAPRISKCPLLHRFCRSGSCSLRTNLVRTTSPSEVRWQWWKWTNLPWKFMKGLQRSPRNDMQYLNYQRGPKRDNEERGDGPIFTSQVLEKRWPSFSK